LRFVPTRGLEGARIAGGPGARSETSARRLDVGHFEADVMLRAAGARSGPFAVEHELQVVAAVGGAIAEEVLVEGPAGSRALTRNATCEIPRTRGRGEIAGEAGATSRERRQTASILARS